MNFTFDLYGVVLTVDNSSRGTQYKVYSDEVRFHDNIGSAIGSVVIDDTIDGIYFYVYNSIFYNNSPLIGAAMSFWHCSTCRGSKNTFGYLTYVIFKNNRKCR